MNLPSGNVTTTSSMTVPRRLNASWGRELWTCFILAALGAYSLWFALYSKADTYHVYEGIAMCVFAWTLAALLSYTILPGKRYLELTSQGFTLTYGFKSFSYNWRDVQDFTVFRSGRMVFVVFNFAGGYAPPTAKRQRGSAYARKLTGYDSGMGSARYGMSAEELAELMNKLRERYAGSTGINGPAGGEA